MLQEWHTQYIFAKLFENIDVLFFAVATFYHGGDKYLADKTLCMCGKHGRGQYDHYDVHSLYGASQIQSTLE